MMRDVFATIRESPTSTGTFPVLFAANVGCTGSELLSRAALFVGIHLKAAAPPKIRLTVPAELATRLDSYLVGGCEIKPSAVLDDGFFDAVAPPVLLVAEVLGWTPPSSPRQQLVRLARIGGRDFQQFDEFDVELSGTSLVIGPNDSGKTSILRAREFDLRPGDAGGDYTLIVCPEAGYSSMFRSFDTHRPFMLRGTFLGFDSQPYTFEFEYRFTSGGQLHYHLSLIWTKRRMCLSEEQSTCALVLALSQHPRAGEHSPASAVGTHVLRRIALLAYTARTPRRALGAHSARLRELTALASGLHAALGSLSPLSLLPPPLVARIAALAFPHRALTWGDREPLLRCCVCAGRLSASGAPPYARCNDCGAVWCASHCDDAPQSPACPPPTRWYGRCAACMAPTVLLTLHGCLADDCRQLCARCRAPYSEDLERLDPACLAHTGAHEMPLDADGRLCFGVVKIPQGVGPGMWAYMRRAWDGRWACCGAPCGHDTPQCPLYRGEHFWLRGNMVACHPRGLRERESADPIASGCSLAMASIEELRETLGSLKRPGRLHLLQSKVLRSPESTNGRHLKGLERELTTSALRLAAKANLLTEILDTAHRLRITAHVREAHELARALLMFGEEMQKGLDETGEWVASERQVKRAVTVIREASNLPKVDEFLVVLRMRLFDLERGASLDVRPRSATTPS
eukprot:m51a1_g1656 hypothetical protein (688) ;mRNA; f:360221-365582